MKLISQGHVKEEESRGLDFSRRKSTTDKNNVFCTNKRSINHDENLINRKALGFDKSSARTNESQQQTNQSEQPHHQDQCHEFAINNNNNNPFMIHFDRRNNIPPNSEILSRIIYYTNIVY